MSDHEIGCACDLCLYKAISQEPAEAPKETECDED